MNWELLWKIVLLFTLFGYALLVIIVILGGSKNIVDMLQDLRNPPQDDDA
jgi:hypothetical protein